MKKNLNKTYLIIGRVTIAILFAIIIFVCAVYGLLYAAFRSEKDEEKL